MRIKKLCPKEFMMNLGGRYAKCLESENQGKRKRTNKINREHRKSNQILSWLLFPSSEIFFITPLKTESTLKYFIPNASDSLGRGGTNEIWWVWYFRWSARTPMRGNHFFFFHFSWHHKVRSRWDPPSSWGEIACWISQLLPWSSRSQSNFQKKDQF